MNTGNDINIVEEILKAMLEARPDSDFIQSLYRQFCERGGLSRKQLEGLHAKAAKVNSIPPGKLATLEAIIRQRPVRHKSEATINARPEPKDEQLGKQLQDILDKYPQHKRIVFLKSKYDHNEPFSPAEKEEVARLTRLLLK